MICMYYYSNFIAESDIFSYMVFRKRRFGRLRKTIMRKHRYRPKKGKQINLEPKILGNRIEFGIFSYSHYCPLDDNELEVWLCKIPKNSMIYSNNWEYTSNKIIFLEKC